MNHSPLCWSIGRESYDRQYIDLDCRIMDDDLGHSAWTGFVRCYGCEENKDKGLQKARSNANFIVDAVNNHYFLIESLANLIKECNNDSGSQIETSDAYQKAEKLLNELRKEK